MKIIIEFYLNRRKVDAWLVDTKNLKGNPKLLKVILTTQTAVPKGT